MKPNQPKTWKLDILLLITQYVKSISRGPLGVAPRWSSMPPYHVLGKALATNENTSASKLSLLQGYFACQLNKSEQFLKIFRLSRLCDQVELVLYLWDFPNKDLKLNFCFQRPDCFKGSDELEEDLRYVVKVVQCSGSVLDLFILGCVLVVL